MCPLVPLAITPHGVSRLGLLGDPRLGVAEDHTDVDVGMLGFHEDHLLAIRRIEEALGFNHNAVL